MAADLLSWEDGFRAESNRGLSVDLCPRAGALLPIIPDYEGWNEFLDAIRAEWWAWQRDLAKYPHCIVVLYGGLAFYQYEEARFWPYFEKAVAQDGNSPVKQKQINTAFGNAAGHLGLPIFCHPGWTDYVGSAVFHIGVPLSLWDGFLDICEWALYQEDWRQFSDDDWKEAVARRAGGRKRLAAFLRDNRKAASAVIQEMLDARKVLCDDKSLTLDGIKGACFIRAEYFDYVPETAEFLRPENPQSLLMGRPRIRWNEERAQIGIYLPPVASLPATWQVGDISQPAVSAGDIVPLNCAAFAPNVTLEIRHQQGLSKRYVLRGAKPWGMFDAAEGWMANSNRHALPVRAYDILSLEPISQLERSGFNDEEYEANELFELEDRTRCYRTHLDPTLRSASVSFVQDGTQYKFAFCDATKLEARVYPGTGYQAAFFRWVEQRMKLVGLPLVCIGIPHDYFQDMPRFVCEKLEVLVGGAPVGGTWIRYYEDQLRSFWQWRANQSAGSHKGKQTLVVKASGIGVIEERTLELESSKQGLDDAWKDLPGSFLPWFVLCQKPSGMTRAEIEHACSVVAAGHEVNYWQLREYARYRYFRQWGRNWSIIESRAVLTNSPTGECEVSFCGNPSILWGMFRNMKDKHRAVSLPKIKVVKERGFPSFVRMDWERGFERDVIKYLRTHHVRIVQSLWELQQ